MAHQLDTDLFSYLGWVVWGDVGDITVYHDKRNRIVAFDKTFPQKPPSPKQEAQRQLLTDAAEAWQALTPAQRQAWELATKRASLAMCGYCLWVHHQLTGDDQAIKTIERQTHTTLIS